MREKWLSKRRLTKKPGKTGLKYGEIAMYRFPEKRGGVKTMNKDWRLQVYEKPQIRQSDGCIQGKGAQCNGRDLCRRPFLHGRLEYLWCLRNP